MSTPEGAAVNDPTITPKADESLPPGTPPAGPAVAHKMRRRRRVLPDDIVPSIGLKVPEDISIFKWLEYPEEKAVLR